jgi:hypothetical protein
MMELPRDTVIDLTNSGFGPTGRTFGAANAPILIVFGPNGDVERVTGLSLADPPTSTIHLLLGRIDQLAEPGSNSTTWSVTYNANLEDLENFWISVGHQTGKVTTAENAWALRPQPPGTPTFTESLRAAREFAQSAQSMGGR